MFFVNPIKLLFVIFLLSGFFCPNFSTGGNSCNRSFHSHNLSRLAKARRVAPKAFLKFLLYSYTSPLPLVCNEGLMVCCL